MVPGRITMDPPVLERAREEIGAAESLKLGEFAGCDRTVGMS